MLIAQSVAHGKPNKLNYINMKTTEQTEQRNLNKYICSYCHEFVNKVYYNEQKDNDFCVNCN